MYRSAYVRFWVNFERMKSLLCYCLLFLPTLVLAQDKEVPESAASGPAPRYYDHRPNDRMQAAKFAFFGPILGQFSLGYERMLNVDLGLDVQVGLVNFDEDPDNTNNSNEGAMYRGGYVALGVKYMLYPDKTQPVFKDKHTMDGLFIMPQLVFSSFDETRHESVYSTNYTGPAIEVETVYSRQSTALILNLGYQVVFKNRLMLQYYAGMGYSMSDNKLKSMSVLNQGGLPTGYTLDGPQSDYFFSHIHTGRAGIRSCFNVGWLF